MSDSEHDDREPVTLSDALMEAIIMADPETSAHVLSHLLMGNEIRDPAMMPEDQWHEGFHRMRALISGMHHMIDVAHMVLAQATTLRTLRVSLDDALRVAQNEGERLTVLDAALLDAASRAASGDMDAELTSLLDEGSAG